MKKREFLVCFILYKAVFFFSEILVLLCMMFERKEMWKSKQLTYEYDTAIKMV